MQINTIHKIISILLSVAILVNSTVPAMVYGVDNNVKGLQTESPLTVDYVVPDWGEDPPDNAPVQNKPAVYENGRILIYHYKQLLRIGSDALLTDTDYLTNRLGAGQQILTGEGQTVRYALDADYEIVQDIALPRHILWQLPDNFSGRLIGSLSPEAPLYDAGKDTVYLYNRLQTAVMAMPDAETQPVMSGDADTAAFGTGNVIYPDGASHYLTYGTMHNYVIAKGFSSDLNNRSVSVRLQNSGTPLRSSPSQYDGRDFQGQVIKKLNGVTYILIGNQEQLREIGSDNDVFSAVYQMDLKNGHYVVDTQAANDGLLYGGDADLKSEHNGYKDYGFKEIDDSTSTALSIRYYCGVNQDTGEVYDDVAHMSLVKNNAIGSWHTGAKYSKQANYIIFRDIDLGGQSTPWTPLMFSGTMTGAVAENGEKLWDGSTISDGTAITAARRAVISNVYVNQWEPIEVNKYIGIGFFATITNEVNKANIGISAGTVKVKNLELNQIEVHNTATTAKSATTILSALTSGLGWLVGGLVDLATTALSFGSMHLSMRDTLSALLNARANDPTIYSTGAFAGRIVGDVEIDNCSVTGSVIVENHKNNTGGFVGYSDGVAQYSGLSNALGVLTDALSSLLNVIPGLGLGDLITILLDNALPLRNLIPTGYLEPHINNCTVENLSGTIGQSNTNSNGGFIGQQVGTQIVNCSIKNSDYIVNAVNYGGGFSGVERDAQIKGTLNDLGVEVVDESQIFNRIRENLTNVGDFQTQSLLRDCQIQNTTVTVNGGSFLGGFSGAMAASYAIDCDIKGTVSNPLSISGTGSNIGGFAGESTIGWFSSIGAPDANPNDNSLLSVVRQLGTGLLSTDSSANQKLLSLVGLVPSAIMGCQIDMAAVDVSGGGSYVGGIVGCGHGLYFSESSAEEMSHLTYWKTGDLNGKTARVNYLRNLRTVTAGGDYAGGIAGDISTVSIAGVLDGTLSAGTFVSFTVRKITVTGVVEGYTVVSNGTDAATDGDFVSGGFGRVCGGSMHEVKLYNLKKVEAANNKAAGFVGAAGPGDLVGSGGLTLNLLGLNNVLDIKNLLSLGESIHVTIADSDVSGIDGGFTVKAKGSGNSNPGFQYLASGFVAQSNSTDVSNCHTDNLKWVRAAAVKGYSGGFIATSQTGGLADVSDVDGIKSLLSIQGGLLNAVSYLIPSYVNCTVTFVNGGYVDADIAGGFVADMQSGTVDNSSISTVDDSTHPKWTKTMSELYDPHAVNPTGDLEKQFAVFNIDSVRGRTYGGGFGGKLRSGALAGFDSGISILGDTSLSINLSDLLGVLNAYVPIVKHAGVYSENGFVVAANTIRGDDPYSGSAGGFMGYASGAQVSHCDVYRLKHTEVTPPDNLEGINGSPYFDNTQSLYAVVGGHYAGGYVGNMDIGDAASVGNGLKFLGTSIQLTNILSALSVVVTTIEHSDVQGAGGGFSVIADGTAASGKVGMAGGYAGAVYGGHIQNSHCRNFYYIIGQEMAGGYTGNMEPGNVSNILDDGSLLNNLLDLDASLASLVEDFVPTIRNSTTACVPCGGAVRAQGASDSGHQRGSAGGFCGHSEGGHIWGLNDSTWKDQNDGIVAGHNFGHNTEGSYVGEQHICTAWRIRSVYGYEYAGGFTGYMESADTADTGNIKLLGGLIKVDNLLNALSAVYPTEKNTAVYGPLENLDIDTWNAWVTYIGQYGGFGIELAQNGAAATQQALDAKLSRYIYGCNVVAGRPVHETTTITKGGIAGGYVGYMVTGVISNGQAYDMKQIRAMRSAGGYAGTMQSGGAASFGSANILGLNLNLGQLVNAAQVFVPTVRSGTVHGWQSGMTVTAVGTDFIHDCGNAGGYVGSAYGAQIWGDKGVDDGPASGCNVTNLRFVRGTNAAGGYAGMATAASVADVNTNASNGLLQKLLNSLISTPGNLASVMQATVTTMRQAAVIPDNAEFGFIVEGTDGTTPRYAGGFAGSLEASVIGSRKGESNIIINGLRGVYGQYYAGGFVGLADVGSVASVSSNEGTGGGTSILALVQAGSVDLLDVFRTYIYYSEVNGVEEGIIVRATTSAAEGILSETRYSGCAGGFGGGVMNGSVKHSKVLNLNTASGLNYSGGFIGHMGKNGVVDVDQAAVTALAGLTTGVLDIFGTIVDTCEVDGIEAGFLISSAGGQEPIAGGFTGYGDLSQVKNCRVDHLKQVYSDQIAGGFIGKTNMNYLVQAEVDSALVQIVLGILNSLLKILQVHRLENIDLLNTDSLLSSLGISNLLGLKLLSDGDLLYVNLLGLRIGVSLVQSGVGQTGTAVITIGDSSVSLPYDENGFNVDNPEVIVNLIKGNRTRVSNCLVRGIDNGCDVFGGGASQNDDGQAVKGYAGGFVGFNKEGKLSGNKMEYCDVVRGTAGKTGPFSGGSSIDSVYSPNTLYSIEGDNNRYSVYRKTQKSYALTSTNEQIGSMAVTDSDTSSTYQRFDVVYLQAPVVPAANETYDKIFEKWKDAVMASDTSASDAERIGVYESSAKAVLMLDNPTDKNFDSMIPEPAAMQDPCEKTIHFTVEKIWNDQNNQKGIRPTSVYVRLIQHWINPDGTDYIYNGQPRTMVYQDTSVIADADAQGWFALTKADHERPDSAVWERVIEGLPFVEYKYDAQSGDVLTDPATGAKLVDHYYSYTVEEQELSDYSPSISYDASGTAAVITNSFHITILKTNENGDGLSGAVFDLFYQDTITPPAYTFNEPVISPVKAVEVTIPAEPAAPDAEPVTVDAGDGITTYRYTYAKEDVPEASATQWILPRSDNDYIYFRDYNSGTPGEHDKTSFTVDNGSNNPMASQSGKRSWLETNLKQNEQTQYLEIDYAHNYWYAAQFSGPDKQDVQYAVWERFVDRYDSNGTQQDTVVWKIQPPDGYNQVRFCLYDGSNCIRTTEKVTFKLGEIYHKTNWGGIYRNENGNHCYFNVPLNDESHEMWAKYSGAPQDKRMSEATNMQQAERYTPTEQKVIVHFNSNQVWHNIHIEFFREGISSDYDCSETVGSVTKYYKAVGQKFPGYMLEPYAYAGDDCRIGNYLTYELTIPAEATYFRVNNGVDGSGTAGSFSNPSSPYAYRSAVRALYGSENNGIKNFDNYFSINGSAGGTDADNSAAVIMEHWSGIPASDNLNKTYTANSVQSDYDYIYFEAPASWGTHIYAYFYDGGSLRDDNWQRACYSVWPGITPVGTEYSGTNVSGTSDIYTYPVTGSSNPDSTMTDQNGMTVYKFRVPLGDRKNYSKVIFNNGLKSQVLSTGGADDRTHETGVISYTPGYLYTASESSRKHYETNPTISYAQRGDYIYIKNTADWDDIHIRFYNAAGEQILQSGAGYLMQYAGKMTAGGTDYFRIPVPQNAAQFSLNNGVSTYAHNTGTGNTYSTGNYAILRLDAAADTSNVTSADFTTGNMVFELKADSSLTLNSPRITMESVVTPSASSQTYTPVMTSPRGDFIYIQDSADVLSSIPAVQFYETQTSASPVSSSLTALKLNDSPAGTKWYGIGIPTNAGCFTINGGTDRYVIYPKSNTSVNQMDVTPANMYYHTVTEQTLLLDWPTFTSNADDLSDEEYPDETGAAQNGQRGDQLYLVHSVSALSDWAGMTVTFYDASGIPIENNNGDTAITAKSLGLLQKAPTGAAPVDGTTTVDDDAVGYWYRTAIPSEAAAFTVSNAAGTKSAPKAEIFEKREKISRYRKDYTLGDMQYRLNDSASAVCSTTLLYPVFSENDNYSLNISDGKTLSTESGVKRVDAAKVSDYSDAAAAKSTVRNDTMTTLPVLYQTDEQNITYSWGGGSGWNYSGYVGFIRPAGWTAVKAYYWGGSNGNSWPGDLPIDTITYDTYTVDIFDLKGNPNVIFNNDDNGKQTVDIDLSSYTTTNGGINGQGYIFRIGAAAVIGTNKDKYEYHLAYYPDDASSIPTTSNIQDGYIYFVHPSGVSEHVTTAYFYNSATGTEKSGWPGEKWDTSWGRRTVTINGTNYDAYRWNISGNSGYDSVVFSYKPNSTNDNHSHIYKTEDIMYANKGVYRANGYENDGSEYACTEDGCYGNRHTNRIYYVESLNEYGSAQEISSSGSKSVSYQPEDRYGYIRSVTDTSDQTVKNAGDNNYQTSSDNFITIRTAAGTTLTDPYIMFYSDDNATIPIGDTSTMAANGISLVKAKITGDTSAADNTSPYKIRLPKNARSFKIGNGAAASQGNRILLYETIDVRSADGTLWSSGDDPHIRITDYHHAGTIFTVDNDGNVTDKTLRTQKNVSVQVITDPLRPRTDNDYIFFTDTGNLFADSDTIYAYYYGGADGEYTPWPGIRASAGDDVPLVYTDNNGSKVYMFQLPKVSDGKYPYVIFNNGSAADGTRKVTQAISIMNRTNEQGTPSDVYAAGGRNYSVTSTSEGDLQHYGTYDGDTANSHFVKAYPVSYTEKASAATVVYNSNKYIYLINNGTSQLDGTASRYLLDDMHIVFYGSDKTTVIGSGYPGYKPDKLMNGAVPYSYSDTAGTAGAGDVYRIQVPADAKYFQITNGSKGTGAYQYERISEIKTVTGNGLYRFVPSASAPADYIEESTAEGNIMQKHFLLELVNEIRNDDEDLPESETYDVLLATVVTGADGMQEKILWLRENDSGSDIDKHYLDHELTDVWDVDNNPDAKEQHIRVKVDSSKCYWKEKVAPAGYKLSHLKYPATDPTTVVIDKRLPSQVALKKTAGEKAGTKDVGTALAGAKFKLVTVNNGSPGNVITLAKLKNKFEYEYYDPTQTDIVNVMIASGEYETDNGALVLYNVMTNDTPPVYDISKALVTGSNGKLKMDNLPWGDYCLEEVDAPAGYSAIDSNTNSRRKIEFSVGSNTVVKNISCTDEMEAAYIKLYEHINEYRPTQWGNPTFIFRIRQTGYYDNTGASPVLKTGNGKEILVALTVDDNGKYTAGLVSHTDPSYDYNEWFQEATDELENGVSEYGGQFRIDSQGRIRLEPGTYEITRMPVSRYEFVENTYTMNNITNQAADYISHRSATEKLTVTIPAQRTAIIHYYDRVAYYDKFSQETEKINDFYSLDTASRENQTLKGIRIGDYHQVGTTGTDADTNASDEMIVPVTSLDIYKIFADGTEKPMTDAEKSALTDFIISYTYDSSTGDAESFGNAAAPAVNDFSYDSTTKTITVTNAQTYKNGVYTLNANYKGFKAVFDIVFETTSP